MEQSTELEEKKKSNALFVWRMIGFTLFACILPFVFIAWRFDIFRIHNEVSARVSLTGWGFLAVIIVFLFVRYIMGALKQAIPFSLTYQILNGAMKVILPLVCLYCVVSALENSIALFKQALFVVIICESIAIVINPIPKFMHDRGIEHINGIMDLAIEKIKKAKGN